MYVYMSIPHTPRTRLVLLLLAGCSAAALLQMHGTCLGLEALANVIAGGKRVLS